MTLCFKSASYYLPHSHRDLHKIDRGDRINTVYSWRKTQSDLTIGSIVLAGGKSSRLGTEKCKEVVAGKSLIEQVIDRLSLLSTEILIVTSQRQSRSYLIYSEAKTVTDLYPERGPLGGIHTGLMHSSCFHNLAVACDMPFLNRDLLHYMVCLSTDFDVVIPRIGDHVQSLHAVYSKNCIKPIEKVLEKGNLKVTAFYDSVRVRYVDKDELDRFDPEHMSFFNINTQADLDKAKVLAENGIIPENHIDMD